MARGHVVVQSYSASVNTMGRAHMNPILDTMMYQVEFAEFKYTELTAKIIAKSMHAQCDIDRNEYLLFDALVDYQKDSKTISLTNQQITVEG